VTPTEVISPSDTDAITADPYRDIHKGIRAELFALTGQAGRIDPSNRIERAALAVRVGTVVETLEAHSRHEDAGIQPTLEEQLPDLAAKIRCDHQLLAGSMARLLTLADEAAEATAGTQAVAVHRLYLQLAEFTAVYLVHQDVEERTVLPALLRAIGPEAIMSIHAAIVSSIPPDEMARSLEFMLPAMNIDGRTQLLAGVQASAPAHVFAGVWGLATSVLTPSDHAALAGRLGIA
jgi:hypothetical protein